MPDYTDEILAIEAKLNAGADRVRTDGVDVEYDLKALRTRHAELCRRTTGPYGKVNRPPWARVDLSDQ